MKPKIAILIPCYNEELTVGHVVGEFREQIRKHGIKL
jgi:glycosyltransferase involved in cell wall biosynthesis